jgi:hypothetical protein
MKNEFVSVAALLDLKVGDVIRGKSSGRMYVVTANYGTRVTAVDSADVTNASEWEVLRPAPNTRES